MRKLGLTITVLFLVVGLTVSLSAFAQSDPKHGGTLKAAFTASPPTLDPHKTTNTITQQVVSHIFEPLFAFDGTFEVQPILVSSWERSEDKLTYTFTLREGVKFHNGQPLTAEDAKASLWRIIEESPISGYYKQVDEIEVVDDLTFKIQLKEPTNLMSAMKIQVTWQGIMPKEYAEKREELSADELVGTGPFELADWEPEVEIVLNKFEDYKSPAGEPSGFAGEKTPYLDEVVIYPVKEVGTRVSGLETGEYDYGAALPTTKFQT
ncbi:MAG: ABC transporter substrate-binding protein, partial [Candidatus Bipolaricaulota bacterium]